MHRHRRPANASILAIAAVSIFESRVAAQSSRDVAACSDRYAACLHECSSPSGAEADGCSNACGSDVRSCVDGATRPPLDRFPFAIARIAATDATDATIILPPLDHLTITIDEVVHSDLSLPIAITAGVHRIILAGERRSWRFSLRVSPGESIRIRFVGRRL